MVASEAKRSNEQWEFDMMVCFGKEQEVEEEEENWKNWKIEEERERIVESRKKKRGGGASERDRS